MKTIGKKFTSVNITWVKVIVLALACAVMTAVLKLIPALNDTSFQDPAINPEFWFLPAVFIIINCNKWWEASLKTFVFFLISQPLIYLIQVPFSAMGFKLFDYYKYWLVITFLTLPGAAIAFLVKKKNWLSAVVLLGATGFCGYMTGEYFWRCVYDFPRHLISVLFCLTLAAFFIMILIDDRKKQLAAIAATVAVIVVALFIEKPVMTNMVELPEGNWSYTISDDSVVEVHKSEDAANAYKIKGKGRGLSYIMFTDENGNEQEYSVTITTGGMYIDEIR